MLTKVPIVKAMVFPVVIYGCEIWTIKKTECQRIDAFKLWCWRRYLKVPWTADQSILKKINPEYLLEWLMLKLQSLATWCKELIPWCWERLRAGGMGGRGWDGWMAKSVDINLSKLWEVVKPGMQSMRSQRVRHDWVTKQQLKFYEFECLYTNFSPKKPIWNQKHTETYSQASGLISTYLLPPLHCSHSTEK